MRLSRRPPLLGRIGQKTAPKDMDMMIFIAQVLSCCATAYPKGRGAQVEQPTHPRRECVHGTWILGGEVSLSLLFYGYPTPFVGLF